MKKYMKPIAEIETFFEDIVTESGWIESEVKENEDVWKDIYVK